MSTTPSLVWRTISLTDRRSWVSTAAAGRAVPAAVVVTVVVAAALPPPASSATPAPPAPEASATATRTAEVRRGVIGVRVSWWIGCEGSGGGAVWQAWDQRALKATSAADEES